MTTSKNLVNRIWPTVGSTFVFDAEAESGDGEGFWARITIVYTLLVAIIVSVLEAFVIEAWWRGLKMIVNQRDTSVSVAPFQPSSNNTTSSTDLQGDQYSAILKAQVVYHASFIFAMMFQVFVTVNAVCQKNILEMGAVVLFAIGTLAYSVYSFFQLDTNVDKLLQDDRDQGKAWVLNFTSFEQGHVLLLFQRIIIIIIGIFVLSLFYLAFQLYKEFGWAVYRKIGGSLELRAIFRNYQFFILSLQFIFYFLLIFQIQLLLLVSEVSDLLKILSGAIGVPWLLLTLAAGLHGLRTENRRAMMGFFVGCAGLSGYVVYRLWRMHFSKNREDYKDSYKFLTFTGVICVVLLTCSFVYGVICQRSFGKGLKKLMYGDGLKETEMTKRTMDLDA
ncbi:hypothetical protein HK102_002726 [Quaeritorhiza haematococci]|nr:hypothetical protein HK102_002726 [Quaeritorhiza haematococci]